MKTVFTSKNRKIRLLLTAVLTLCMLTALLCPTAYAELDGEVIFDNCDSSTWHGGTAKDYEEKTEGIASVSWTIAPGASFVIQRNLEAPVDATGANFVMFDLYVSSADNFYCITGGNSLELTSSGTCDVEETAWNLNSLEVVDGWNEIALGLPENGEGCDFSRVNFMRLYALGHNTTEAYTIKIDNIRFVYIDPETLPSGVQENLVIGTGDATTAVPVLSTSDEQPIDGQPADETSAGAPVVALAMLGVAGALAIALLVLLLLKKNNRIVLIVLVAALVVCAAIGVIGVLTSGGEVPDDQPSDDTPSDSTPDGNMPFEDQTGHPEVSADRVDVEALLRVDPDYNTKKDYKVFYDGTPRLSNLEGYPHIIMTEVPEEHGIKLQQVTAQPLEKLTIADHPCWLFVHMRKDDTNQFRLSLDDSAKASLEGKNVRLTFAIYVSANLTFKIDYMTVAVEKKTAEVTQATVKGKWTEMSVDLLSPAFTGAFDGYDFYVTCTGPEIIRLHAVHADEYRPQNEPVTGVIKTKHDTPFQIIADANVLEFGAKGDGVSNDTQAFKDAISYVNTQGGGTVFVPVGYYCLTETLTLPTNVALVGDLEQGTANGTVLCIYHGKGETDPKKSAIMLNQQSSVQNMAFWYPEQTFVNGSVIPYPPTITQCGSEGVTVRNITFVNAYFGINYGTLFSQASNSLQYTRDIYGTCLHIGYENTPSYDIGKLENFHFSPDYWLNSGLPGTPNEALLRTFMLRNSTGIILERIDWTYIADIYVDGYHKGMLCRQVPEGTPNGHMYNINLLDCYYCFYGKELSWMIASDCHFRAVGNDGAAAVYLSPACGGDMVFVGAVLESAGANAVLNYGSSKVILNDCEVSSKTGTAVAIASGADYSLVNTTVKGGDNFKYTIVTDDTAPKLPTDVDYGKTVVTKPKSDKLIRLTEAPYNAKPNTDITDILQKAIDDLKETGGTVWLPAGAFIVNDHIDVWAGVELRGIAIWAHSFTPTRILTDFGRNDPDGEALFTLHEGAGMIGMSVVYHQQNIADLQPYSFTVQGKGKDIYLVDVTLPSSWNGVDFATYRCDNHYIEYLHGAFLNTGIQVGSGSENGIIRDCHFTPNCFPLRGEGDWWASAYNSIMTRGRPFVIGESKNQIMYHNFTYGAYQGLTVLDGAENVYILSHGVDSGDISAYFSGDCSVTLVNTELVNLYTTGTAKHFNYVYTEEDFTGTVNFINVAGWGTSRNAFNLNGDGTVNVYGGNIVAAGAPMCRLNAGSASFIGVINAGRTTDAIAGDMALGLNLSGNLFASGVRLDDSFSDDMLTGSDIQ